MKKRVRSQNTVKTSLFSGELDQRAHYKDDGLHTVWWSRYGMGACATEILHMVQRRCNLQSVLWYVTTIRKTDGGHVRKKHSNDPTDLSLWRWAVIRCCRGWNAAEMTPEWLWRVLRNHSAIIPQPLRIQKWITHPRTTQNRAQRARFRYYSI